MKKAIAFLLAMFILVLSVGCEDDNKKEDTASNNNQSSVAGKEDSNDQNSNNEDTNDEGDQNVESKPNGSTNETVGGGNNQSGNNDKNDTIVETNAKDFEYESVSGGVKITNYKGNSKKVVIPSILGNKKVVSIASTAFSGNAALTEITLPEGVTTFDLNLFKNCDALTNVTCKGEIEKIEYLRYELKALKTVEFNKITAEAYSNIDEIFGYGDYNYSKKLSNIVIKEMTQFKSDFVFYTGEGRGLRSNKVNITVSDSIIKMCSKMKAYQRVPYFEGELAEELNYNSDIITGYSAFKDEYHKNFEAIDTSSYFKTLNAEVVARFKESSRCDEVLEWKIISRSYRNYLVGTMKRNGKTYAFEAEIDIDEEIETVRYDLRSCCLYEPLNDIGAVMCIFFGFKNPTVNGKAYKLPSNAKY